MHLLLTLSLLVATTSALCYYPDGTTGSDSLKNYYDFKPCNGENTTFSQCCYFDEGDVCLPNGMCHNVPKGYKYRAACENKDWEGCQLVCPDVWPNSWVAVMQCSTGAKAEWCCSYDLEDNCCNDGTPRFFMEESLPTSSSSVSSLTPATGAPPTSTAGDTAGAQSSEPTADTNPSKSVIGPAVGGAVGGVAFLAIIGVLAFYFIRRRKNHPDASAATPTDPDSSAAKLSAGYYAPTSHSSGQIPVQEADSIRVRRPAEMQG